MRSAISPWMILPFVIVVLLLASCTPTAPPESPPPPASRAQPSVDNSSPAIPHWIQDKKLRQVMSEVARRLPNLPRDGNPGTGLTTRPVSAEEFYQIATIAAALSDSSEQIAPVVTNIAMSDSDRRGFTADTQSLREQAYRLQQAADSHDIDAVKHSMDAINATCISCHSRYRDFSGQIDLSRGRS